MLSIWTCQKFCHLVKSYELTLSQTSPGLCVCSTNLLKTLWEKAKLHIKSNLSFFHSVFYPFGELSAFSSTMKLSSANSISLEESKICDLGKGSYLPDNKILV